MSFPPFSGLCCGFRCFSTKLCTFLPPMGWGLSACAPSLQPTRLALPQTAVCSSLCHPLSSHPVQSSPRIPFFKKTVILPGLSLSLSLKRGTHSAFSGPSNHWFHSPLDSLIDNDRFLVFFDWFPVFRAWWPMPCHTLFHQLLS